MSRQTGLSQTPSRQRFICAECSRHPYQNKMEHARLANLGIHANAWASSGFHGQNLLRDFSRMLPFPRPELRHHVWRSLLSFWFCFYPSKDVDDSVQVPISQLLAIGNAIHAQVKAAIHASLAIFMFFACRLDAPVIAMKPGCGRVCVCVCAWVKHIGFSELRPMVRERLLYRSVHARDLWRWFYPISISVSVLSTVNLDHAALLGHPFGEHAVRCIHKRSLFHSIIRHLSPCKLFFVCVSDSRNVRISITVIEVPGSLMGIVCTCSARLGQCFCGLCYSILFWSLIGLCTDFSASTETNMNGARVELATVGGSQRVRNSWFGRIIGYHMGTVVLFGSHGNAGVDARYFCVQTYVDRIGDRAAETASSCCWLFIHVLPLVSGNAFKLRGGHEARRNVAFDEMETATLSDSLEGNASTHRDVNLPLLRFSAPFAPFIALHCISILKPFMISTESPGEECMACFVHSMPSISASCSTLLFSTGRHQSAFARTTSFTAQRKKNLESSGWCGRRRDTFVNEEFLPLKHSGAAFQIRKCHHFRGHAPRSHQV